MRPTLALLIPAYNAERFLPRLLTSAHAQTVPFDEIWVYDDCSTDGTAAVAEANGAQVLRGDVNLGCSAGKNALARHVNTDWIHFHDADDELTPSFVERARTWMALDQHDVVLFAYEYRDDTTKTLITEVSFDHESLTEDPSRYAIRNQINPFCGLYRRTAVLAAGGYDEDPDVLYNEDVAFHIRLAFAGLRFAADPCKTVINYRVEGSMSASNQLRCAIAHYHVLRKAWDAPQGRAYPHEIGEKLWKVAGTLAAYGDWDHAGRAGELAARLAGPTTGAGKLWFRLLAALSPVAALRMREAAIRAVKPHLRRNMP